ncbi:MAG: orotidine-5'-phosphate decarboxylase [Treponema sp.]|nr:orotidine-5'-phosphate decarboxylase [Treponema sp.]
MNIDKLYENVKNKGHVCLGLDTCIDYIPAKEIKKARNDSEAALSFNKSLIDSTYDIAACYKVQIAYYEEMGVDGLKIYSDTLKYIKSKGCLAIADIKRSDIADTAFRYAKAHYSGDFEADFVTLNPYLGMDSLEPWIKMARNSGGKGAFVLMRTSNPGMKDFEYLELNADPPEKKRLYNEVGKRMSRLADEYKGSSGYGMFGVVIGCTEKDEAAEIRKTHSDLFFLIPGYGAQGGGAAEAALLLRNGNGGVVNASRSIITAWRNQDLNGGADNAFAAMAAREAAIKMRDDIRKAINEFK